MLETNTTSISERPRVEKVGDMACGLLHSSSVFWSSDLHGSLSGPVGYLVHIRFGNCAFTLMQHDK
jgi:hypothetical protein